MSAGIYLHVPFCKSRCSYCDFATDVYRDSGAVELYVDTLCKEIVNFGECYALTDVLASAPDCGGPRVSKGVTLHADTIYFGGGTPSLITPDQVERILKAVNVKFAVASTAEITMEMNPATVTPETLVAFRSLGINRASFGVQTFDDHLLKLLARGHDASDARSTFAMLRDAGFDNVSFDLIAGLPHQTLADWERNLDEAVHLSPEHLSLYLLEIHEGTPLAEQVRSHRQPTPDPELAGEMYELMLDRLAAAGYAQYEISNYARPGCESQHNRAYWLGADYLGFGPGAFSTVGLSRWENVRDTAGYTRGMLGDAPAFGVREELSAETRAGEIAAFRIRMAEGIPANELGRWSNAMAGFQRIGLVEEISRTVRLTRRGKLLADSVAEAFV